jgi:pilus assembly protein CpaE
VAGQRVLIVDDDEVLLGAMQSFLSSRGIEVETAGDGKQALRVLNQESPPDLIITDVRMPELGGLELTSQLRKDPRTAHIPIIVLSERKRADEMLAGYTVGADDYMPKPVDLPILAAKVETMLRRARMLAAPAASAKHGTVVYFLHGRGGVGTTTLALNVAIALLQGGSYPVALLDLDLEFGAVPVMLNLVPRYTIADFGGALVFGETEEARLQDAILQHESKLWVIAGSILPEKAGLVTAESVGGVISLLQARAEYVIIDAAPTFSEVNLAALDACDMVCLVGAPQLPALKATADCVDVLNRLEIPSERTLLVLNQTTPTALTEKQVTLFLERMSRAAPVTVPYTPQCIEAANSGRPLITAFPTNPVSRKAAEIASRLTALTASAGKRVPEDPRRLGVGG